MRRKILFLPLFQLGLLFLTSCSLPETFFKNLSPSGDTKSVLKEQLDKEPPPQKVGTKQSQPKTVEPENSGALAKKQYQAQLLRKKTELNNLLEKRDFLTALLAAVEGIKQGVQEEELTREYLSALNGVVEQGGLQLDANHPDQAGLLFRAALNSYPKDVELVTGAELTTEELETSIALCAKMLMERGLTAYRSGELNDAIGLWKRVLEFDPQHQASQKAIQTVSTQLTNLKKITDDSSQ
ncbi:MAG: hypothetical protein QNK24_07975 [Desulfuromusa sp.]|nr:hypothetical protein [Desulfuromusa sp.]